MKVPSTAAKPRVSFEFEVEKIIGISGDGSYQVQWAPTWVNKFHLIGCEHLIQEFLQQQQNENGILPPEFELEPEIPVSEENIEDMLLETNNKMKQSLAAVKVEDIDLEAGAGSSTTPFSNEVPLELNSKNNMSNDFDMPANLKEYNLTAVADRTTSTCLTVSTVMERNSNQSALDPGSNYLLYSQVPTTDTKTLPNNVSLQHKEL